MKLMTRIGTPPPWHLSLPSSSVSASAPPRRANGWRAVWKFATR